MKRKSLEFRGTPVKTNSRGTPVKNKSRETPVKNTPEPFGPPVEDLEAVFHEEMDISMEEEEMSLENRIRAKKNLSSQVGHLTKGYLAGFSTFLQLLFRSVLPKEF